MQKYIMGFIAGLFSTIVLSVLMIIKNKFSIMPHFSIIQDLNQFFSMEQSYLGWAVHFLIGTFIWGGLYVFMQPALAGAAWLKGINFGIIAWLLMMVGFMPVMDNGFFASQLGLDVLISSLVLHMLYGFMLGLSYHLFETSFQK